MKKMLLTVLCGMVVCAGTMKAQAFDEEALVGKWVRTTAMQPVDDYLVSIDSLGLGLKVWQYSNNHYPGDLYKEYCNGVFWGSWQGEIDMGEDMSYEYDAARILDFSITNGDKLHIGIVDDFTLVFKIVSLTDDELVVSPLGSSNTITFRKQDGAVTSAKSLRASQRQGKSAVYDTGGVQQPTVGKGVNIIRKSDGTTTKVLVK